LVAGSRRHSEANLIRQVLGAVSAFEKAMVLAKLMAH